MEYIMENLGVYKRGKNIMSQTKEKKLTKKLYKIYLSVLSILILPALGYMIVEIVSLNREISAIEYMNEDIKEINDGLNGDNGLYARFAVIESKLGIDVSTINISDNEFYAYVEGFTNEYRSANPQKQQLNSKTIIGIDSNNNVCLAEDYINKTVLLTYKDKNNEQNNVDVYFLGQYNENYHWDGFCVTNVYYSDGELNGKLYEICESDFDDGERLNFKSIHYNLKENDWLYSDREIKDDVNIGINEHFLFDYDKIKDFTSSNLHLADIMYVDDFMQNIDATLIKYYSGDTSDGYFNDTSGAAYRVTYFNDGTVESLYMGNFIDGPANDNTGNAWEIHYSDKDKSYIYCKGIFSDDKYKGKDIKLINIDEINKIISKYNFECNLKWKEN